MNDRAFVVNIKIKKRLFRKPLVTVIISDGVNDVEFPEWGGAFTIETDKPLYERVLWQVK